MEKVRPWCDQLSDRLKAELLANIQKLSGGFWQSQRENIFPDTVNITARRLNHATSRP